MSHSITSHREKSAAARRVHTHLTRRDRRLDICWSPLWRRPSAPGVRSTCPRATLSADLKRTRYTAVLVKTWRGKKSRTTRSVPNIFFSRALEILPRLASASKKSVNFCRDSWASVPPETRTVAVVSVVCVRFRPPRVDVQRRRFPCTQRRVQRRFPGDAGVIEMRPILNLFTFDGALVRCDLVQTHRSLLPYYPLPSFPWVRLCE